MNPTIIHDTIYIRPFSLKLIKIINKEKILVQAYIE